MMNEGLYKLSSCIHFLSNLEFMIISNQMIVCIFPKSQHREQVHSGYTTEVGHNSLFLKAQPLEQMKEYFLSATHNALLFSRFKVGHCKQKRKT